MHNTNNGTKANGIHAPRSIIVCSSLHYLFLTYSSNGLMIDAVAHVTFPSALVCRHHYISSFSPRLADKQNVTGYAWYASFFNELIKAVYYYYHLVSWQLAALFNETEQFVRWARRKGKCSASAGLSRYAAVRWSATSSELC
jgi:hypothetical protein